MWHVSHCRTCPGQRGWHSVVVGLLGGRFVPWIGFIIGFKNEMNRALGHLCAHIDHWVSARLRCISSRPADLDECQWDRPRFVFVLCRDNKTWHCIVFNTFFSIVSDNILPNYWFHVFFVKIMGDPYVSDLKPLSVLIEIHSHCFTRDHLKNASLSLSLSQNLTSIDVRIWRPKSVLALTGLINNVSEWKLRWCRCFNA